MDLQETLRLHGLWLQGLADGLRANLRGADLSDADLRSADLRSADLSDADLRSADLRSADLRSADLSDADLRSADLRSADLRSANLRSADLRSADLSEGLAALKVKTLHVKTLEALEAGGHLQMGAWHSCATTHCRAGWYIELAGPAGQVAEALLGPATAGAIIVAVSCPWLERVPDFYALNEAALADIRRCAEIELALEAGS